MRAFHANQASTKQTRCAGGEQHSEKALCTGSSRRGWVMPIDYKAAIAEEVKEIDLALSVLNGLRDVNMARLALIEEAEKRSKQTWSVAVINGYACGEKVLKMRLTHPFVQGSQNASVRHKPLMPYSPLRLVFYNHILISVAHFSVSFQAPKPLYALLRMYQQPHHEY